MSPKNLWGLYWLGITIAGLGSAILLFQIDNIRIGAPNPLWSWAIGALMVIAGAASYGWARDQPEARRYPKAATHKHLAEFDRIHPPPAEEIFAAGAGDTPAGKEALANFIRIRADVTAVLLDAADQLDRLQELEPSPVRAALATRLREMGMAP